MRIDENGGCLSFDEHLGLTGFFACGFADKPTKTPRFARSPHPSLRDSHTTSPALQAAAIYSWASVSIPAFESLEIPDLSDCNWGSGASRAQVGAGSVRWRPRLPRDLMMGPMQHPTTESPVFCSMFFLSSGNWSDRRRPRLTGTCACYVEPWSCLGS